MKTCNKFDNLGSIFPKMVFKLKKRGNEHRYLIPNTRTTFSTKLHLPQIILKFSSKFAKRGYVRSKAEKVNITTI